jgi:TRAP-type C4-dicarboxylate transport system permease small subunit
MLARVRNIYEKFLEAIVIVLMVALAVEVTLGVVFRYIGHALVWYDEVATILLAWVTYYGAALAALKRAHLGVPELVGLLPPLPRVVAALFAEACVFAFFIVLAWVGYSVLEVLATDTLVSLPGVSVAYTQSVIPVSAVLFIIAEALVLPDVLREARRLKPAHVNADGLT